MNLFRVRPVSSIKGTIQLPSDKSITHRAIILSAISEGKTQIEGVSLSKDCSATLGLFKKLNSKIVERKSKLIIEGKGLRGLSATQRKIWVGESGTTMRIACGVLAGQDFDITLVGAKSLSSRPMRRVTEPLRMMGARIETRQRRQGAGIEEYPPLTIRGRKLKAITYRLPVASAQVKSAILLAGLFARGITRVIEPIKTRDHTERMLKLFKADLKTRGKIISIKGNLPLKSPGLIKLPRDISAASFFIVAAILTTKSDLTIKSVGINPSRCGLIRILKRMGADINIRRRKALTGQNEPIGDLRIKSSRLRSTLIKKSQVPSLIDELPILMVAAALAKGKTRIESVQELRVKETDRINSMIKGLTKMGAKIKVIRKKRREDLLITGIEQLKGASLRSFGDHRTAMSLIIAGLTAKNDSYIDEVGCINKSFPDFLQILSGLIP